MLWPWLFFATSLFGGWLTLNALRPSYRGLLVGPSFAAAWLTAELAPFHIAIHLASAALFSSLGGLDTWPSLIALVVTLLSCGGLAFISLTARRANHALDAALDACLPQGKALARATTSYRQLLFPFYLRDANIERIGDLRYGTAGRRNALDVYRRREGVEKAPVLVQIHGGAWVVGDKRQQGLPLMLHMAKRGWISVGINYRLAPRSQFPAQLIDCKRAIAWVRENIERYGGDPSRIVVTGGSAGGHLAALVALTPGDPRYQPGFEEADTSVLACVPVYGPYDLARLFGARTSGENAIVERIARLVMGVLPDEAPEAYREASPIARIDEKAPPFFVIHGKNDNLVPVAQARSFVEALSRRSKAKVAYAELPGAPHAFDVFHSMRTAALVTSVERFASFVAEERSSEAGREAESAVPAD